MTHLFPEFTTPALAQLESVLANPVATALLKLTLLLAFAWIAHALLRHSNPRWRILLWRTTAMAILLLVALSFAKPQLSLAVLPAQSQTAPITETATPTATVEPPAPPAVTPQSPHPWTIASPPDQFNPNAPSSPVKDIAAHVTPAASPPPPQPAPSTTQPKTWSIQTILATIWLAGLLLFGLRTLVGMVRIHHIRRTASPLPDALQSTTSNNRLQSPRTEIRQSARVASPCSLGLLRPLVLLPNILCDDEHHTDARAAIAHELAHIRGNDLLWNALLHGIALAGWFHPLLWRIRLAHADACDARCDAEAATQIGNLNQYARSLARIALTSFQSPPTTVMTMARTSTIRRRIEHLHAERGSRTIPIRRSLAFLLTLLTITASIGTLQLTRSYAEEPSTTQAAETSQPVKDQPENNSPTPKAATENTSQPPADTFIKTVRIVDPDRNPIKGATVEPWAIRYQGGHGTWGPKNLGQTQPPKLTTNAEGEVSIPVPQYAAVSQKLPPWGISVALSHPEFVPTMRYDISVIPEKRNETETVVMARGAQVFVTARADGQPVSSPHLYALTAGTSIEGPRNVTTTDEGLRVNCHLPAGQNVLRLVYLPEDGLPMFSDPQTLKLENGQSLHLEVDLHPSLQIEGRLDDSVPRPVKNGRIGGMVTYLTEPSDGIYSFMPLYWVVNADIREDGTFTLNGVPPGDLQAIAQCDGFIAANGNPPAFAPTVFRLNLREHDDMFLAYPQVFPISNETSDLLIRMRPTGKARIRLLDPNGKPIHGAEVSFYPNLKWWPLATGVYNVPKYGSATLIKSLELIEKIQVDNFVALTDKDGVAEIKDLPPGFQQFYVESEDWEQPLKGQDPAQQLRSTSITLTPGQTTEVTLTVQPKGTEPIEVLEKRPDPETPAELETPAEPATANPPQRRTTIANKPRPAKVIKTQSADTELTGVVIDEQGNPIEGVDVDAWTWHPGNETKTDAAGRFSLKDFERRDAIEIEFTKPGYSPSLFIAQPVGTNDWTIVLTQGTILKGQLTDPSGQPLPNVTVRAQRGPFQNPNVVIGEVKTETRTDDAGHYQLLLEPDTYQIDVRVPKVGVIRLENVEVAAKQQTTHDLQLETGTTLRATVRNSVTNEPVEGIMLWNWRKPDIEGTSNSDGLLEITGLSASEVELNVTAKEADGTRSAVAGQFARWWSPQAANPWERLEQKPGEFQRNLDALSFKLQGETYEVDIFVEPAVTITGRVVDPDGNPVEGATVTAAKTDSGNSLTGDTRYSYATDAQGRFEAKFPASKDVKYNLIAHDGAYNQWRKWANATTDPIQTKPGETLENIELRLTTPGIVKGRVLDAQGNPKPFHKVRASPTDGRSNRYYVPTTKTDADGNYTLNIVSPGENNIQIDPIHRYLDHDRARRETTQTVTVTAGKTTIANFPQEK